jgi:amino acid transporter
MPPTFIAGFIPMFLTAYAYRELNSRAPDCGASFTWSTKAFGPYVGWMCGWGMVIATIIVLSNLAAIAVEFFYLFVARIFNNPEIADLANIVRARAVRDCVWRRRTERGRAVRGRSRRQPELG